MNNLSNARTLFLAIILATFSVGYTFAQNKVVVIPLAGDTVSGISGYEIVTNSEIINPTPTNEGIVQAICPPGKRVLGGGGRESNDLLMTDSFPISIGTGWQVGWVRDTGGGLNSTTAFAYAICAKVS